jgi:hypothetical protein
MAREYTFDVQEFVDAVTKTPWRTNVDLGKKFGISRERVRQMRIEKNLPAVNDAKEKWVMDNFDYFIYGASKGKFFTNNVWMEQFPVSERTVENMFRKNPQYKEAYDKAIADYEYNRRFPTEKRCLTCKETLPIDSFYKSSSDKTPDGYGRKCKACNISEVKKYYEIRKTTEKVVPEYKHCSAVPEVGLLPKSEFRKMTTANTGLQPQCTPYQDFFVSYRKTYDLDTAREFARQSTIAYYINFRNGRLSV